MQKHNVLIPLSSTTATSKMTNSPTWAIPPRTHDSTFRRVFQMHQFTLHQPLLLSNLQDVSCVVGGQGQGEGLHSSASTGEVLPSSR